MARESGAITNRFGAAIRDREVRGRLREPDRTMHPRAVSLGHGSRDCRAGTTDPRLTLAPARPAWTRLAPRGHGGAIDGEQAWTVTLWPVLSPEALGTATRHRITQCAVGEQSVDACRERPGLRGIDEQAVAAILHQLGQPAAGRTHHRSPRGTCFEDDHRAVLLPERGQDHDCRSPQPAGDLLRRDPADVLDPRVPFGGTDDELSQRTISGDHQAAGGPNVSERGKELS